ncbi:hypothetical protein MAR_028834 [Mya arenaria]|uniref:Uncharacterized protein n=1 Tax=Mya arenaria TaxID=6604 RepID=A0ABY7DFT2_MYAAR|nr:hypothetical protein MAR_028834 [Mya arenaria]
MEIMVKESEETVNMLQASKHQGHASYNGCGRQCVANSVAAIWQGYQQPPAKWEQQTLDNVLSIGDQLYVDITSKSGYQYLSLEDIPDRFCSLEITKGLDRLGLNGEWLERPQLYGSGVSETGLDGLDESESDESGLKRSGLDGFDESGLDGSGLKKSGLDGLD